MKELWEDSHIMYDEEKDDKKIYWQDFIGGLILLTIIFFTGYGMYTFFRNMFF